MSDYIFFVILIYPTFNQDLANNLVVLSKQKILNTVTKLYVFVQRCITSRNTLNASSKLIFAFR